MLVDGADLSVRFRKGATRPDHVVRSLRLVADWPLRGEPGPCLCFGKPVTREQPADLFRRRAGGHDDAIEVVLVARLEQQGISATASGIAGDSLASHSRIRR